MCRHLYHHIVHVCSDNDIAHVSKKVHNILCHHVAHAYSINEVILREAFHRTAPPKISVE